jgi:hypothetical protein
MYPMNRLEGDGMGLRSSILQVYLAPTGNFDVSGRSTQGAARRRVAGEVDRQPAGRRPAAG